MIKNIVIIKKKIKIKIDKFEKLKWWENDFVVDIFTYKKFKKCKYDKLKAYCNTSAPRTAGDYSWRL